MKLDLLNKLTLDEQEEVKKRVFSFAEQMFLNGVSVGQELNRDHLQEGTEKYIRERISFMTSYFLRDDVWEAMPPHGYVANASFQEYNPETSEFKADVNDMINTATSDQKTLDIGMNKNRPEWANETTPEWTKETKPFK